MIDQRWKDRIAFLDGWIAHLKEETHDPPPENQVHEWHELRDKLYQLEEERFLKAELLARWEEQQKKNEVTESQQKEDMLRHFGSTLLQLKDMRLDGKAKELAKGVLDRNGKGSHNERWRDYTIAKNLIANSSKLVKA